MARLFDLFDQYQSGLDVVEVDDECEIYLDEMTAFRTIFPDINLTDNQ